MLSLMINPIEILSKPERLKKMTTRDLRIMKERMEKSIDSPYYRVANDAVSIGFKATNTQYKEALNLVKKELKGRKK